MRAQQPAITSFLSDGTIVWTNVTTGCLAVLEYRDAGIGGLTNWMEEYSEIPTALVSQAVVDFRFEGAVHYRVVNRLAVSLPLRPAILSFLPDGTIVWTNVTTNCLAVLEYRDVGIGGLTNWMVEYSETPTALLSQTVVEFRPEGAAHYRVVNLLNGGVPQGMALVPPGPFSMGDTFGEGAPDETDLHEVVLDAFYVDTAEVSNEDVRDALQWAYEQGLLLVSPAGVSNAVGTVHELVDLDDPDCRLTWDEGSSTFGIKALKGVGYPCVEITWYGACAVASFRSAMEGLTPCYAFGDGSSEWTCDWTRDGYRLPTEAEWERAARGGAAGRRFPSADTLSHSNANYYSLAVYDYDVSPTRDYHPDYDQDGWPYTSPVATFAANGYGLQDAAGNVAEWCWDWYESAYYATSPEDNPRGPATGTQRVLRGGSWLFTAYDARVARRLAYGPLSSYEDLGFRCVRRVP